MQESVFNTDVYWRIIFLFCTLIVQIIDKRYVYSYCIRKMHNDLKTICVPYCLVIT